MTLRSSGIITGGTVLHISNKPCFLFVTATKGNFSRIERMTHTVRESVWQQQQQQHDAANQYQKRNQLMLTQHTTYVVVGSTNEAKGRMRLETLLWDAFSNWYLLCLSSAGASIINHGCICMLGLCICVCVDRHCNKHHFYHFSKSNLMMIMHKE